MKHGVAHLLSNDRKDDAEERMLNLQFVAAFAGAWPTVVEILTAWRLVGLERAREGYGRTVAALGPPENASERDGRAAGDMGLVLERMGLYAAGLDLASWALPVRPSAPAQRAGPIPPPGNTTGQPWGWHYATHLNRATF